MILKTKIPVTVITGFLGAGKTSLIRHMLQNNSGKKLGLIINEFGDLGVDGNILKSCQNSSCSEEDIFELTNGCICCTVADDFIPTLEALLNRDERPDHIIIETSGLALPKPLVKAFQWPEVRTKTTVDGVIAVVDGPAIKSGLFANEPELIQQQRKLDPSLDHENPLEEVFNDQLTCADLVIVNKVDIMSKMDITEVLDLINHQLRGPVEAITAIKGKIDPGIVLGIKAAVEDNLSGRPSIHGDEEHEHDDFETITINIDSIDVAENIVSRVEDALQHTGVLRIKGVIPVSGKAARYVIQGVGTRVDSYFDRPWERDEKRVGQLVVIGLRGFDASSVQKRLTS